MCVNLINSYLINFNKINKNIIPNRMLVIDIQTCQKTKPLKSVFAALYSSIATMTTVGMATLRPEPGMYVFIY